MRRTSSPRRYAQAVFQIAVEKDGLDTWMEDLRFLSSALEDRDFSDLLDAPQISAGHKLSMVRQTLGDSVGTLALNLVSILASQSLAHTVSGVLGEYERLVDAHRGIERAEIVSAVPVDKGQLAETAKLLEGIVGKEVRLTSTVEPQVIGGLIVRVGDRVIDGSVKAKLSDMRSSIVEQGS
jgi:F-type H+-transporting ATPase subunit delta